MRELGTPRFSWVDLRVIVGRAQNDPKSALFQSLHPEDHFWADPNTRLLAAIATDVSWIKYLTVVPMVDDVKNMPAEWRPDRYGPPPQGTHDDSEEEESAVSVERARAIAAEIRAEMVVA